MDSRFAEPYCFVRKYLTEAVAELAHGLGLRAHELDMNWASTARFTGCFQRGSGKLDALRYLLELACPEA